jgi:hypothetical protein
LEQVAGLEPVVSSLARRCISQLCYTCIYLIQTHTVEIVLY